jgi:hypothetical protein
LQGKLKVNPSGSLHATEYSTKDKKENQQCSLSSLLSKDEIFNTRITGFRHLERLSEILAKY